MRRVGDADESETGKRVSRSVVSDSLWPHQAPLSVGFSRQEHWSGLPFPSPGDRPHPGIEPASPALAGRFSII